MCDKAADACQSLLKFVPDWFVTNKMLEHLDNAVFFNDGKVFVNTDSYVSIFSDDMGLVNVDVNNFSLSDNNFDFDDPETVIHVKLVTWCKKLKQRKACKKEISKELLHGAWHFTRW